MESWYLYAVFLYAMFVVINSTASASILALYYLIDFLELRDCTLINSKSDFSETF